MATIAFQKTSNRLTHLLGLEEAGLIRIDDKVRRVVLSKRDAHDLVQSFVSGGQITADDAGPIGDQITGSKLADEVPDERTLIRAICATEVNTEVAQVEYPRIALSYCLTGAQHVYFCLSEGPEDCHQAGQDTFLGVVKAVLYMVDQGMVSIDGGHKLLDDYVTQRVLSTGDEAPALLLSVSSSFSGGPGLGGFPFGGGSMFGLSDLLTALSFADLMGRRSRRGFDRRQPRDPAVDDEGPLGRAPDTGEDGPDDGQ